MRSSVVCLLFVLVALLPHAISAQSEGDVRLEGGTSNNKGRLEIFWEGKWSTFCGLSKGGAQAACRQLGYLDVIYHGPLRNNPNITEADPETPIAIQETDCEYTFSNGLLHVLRCGYNTKVDADCTHMDDIVLQCQTTSLYQHPYETQVRLVADSSDDDLSDLYFDDDVTEGGTVATSSGTLEIYLNGKWGNVCGDQFDEAAANSACRQMGYTSASHYTTTFKSQDTIWLRDLSCNGASCNCLSGCYGNRPTTPATCSNGDVTQVTCTYDIAIADEAFSGSRDDCESKKSVCNNPSGPSGSGGLSPGAAAGVAIVVILVVLVAIFGVVVAVFVFLPKWKKRGYASVK